MANERKSPSEPGGGRDQVDVDNIRGVADEGDDFEESDDEDLDADDEEDDDSTTF